MAIKVSKQDAVAPEATVVLDLAVYERYNRLGELYEKGVGYVFSQEQANVLLAEQEADSGSPVWKIYVSKKAAEVERAPREPEPVDKTRAVVEVLESEEMPGKTRRIDIGDDSEIEELLGNADDDTVTV